MRGDAIPFSVRPLVAAVLFGVLLGACGGGSSDSGHLEPSLGQGNAELIRAEYQAALKAAEQRQDMMRAAALPAGSVAQDIAPAQMDLPISKESLDDEAVSPMPVGTGAEALAHAQPFHALAREVVEKVNAIRAQPQRCGDTMYPAAGPLVWNARVAYAALLESEWMVKTNSFSHQWEDGKYVWDRFDMAHYAWSKADENIAAGFSTLDKAMQAWLESPSHCKAMMRPDIREIGLSVLPGREGSRYNSYWTMALGTPGH
ncbi:MAG: CAP domain-containing protein [Lautropia sp.]|nr:CAP domain-containing protein [Lautropia sp.]